MGFTYTVTFHSGAALYVTVGISYTEASRGSGMPYSGYSVHCNIAGLRDKSLWIHVYCNIARLRDASL